MAFKLIPAGQGYARLTEAVTTEYGQLIDLVRQAVRDKLRLSANGDYYVDVRGIWPDRVVVQFKGRLYSYAYTVAADNTVALADATEVVADYAPVGAAPAPSPTPTPVAVAVREAVASDAAVFREAADGSIEVTLVRAGRSVNRNYYPDAVLRESAPMFEGVRVFNKTDAEHISGAGKAVDKLLGAIYGVRFVEGKGVDSGALVGTFKPINPSDPTVTKMVEAVKRGMQNLLGLSIDATARTKKRMQGAEQLREAVRFLKVDSVDLIVEPGAGGGLDRLVEAAADQSITKPKEEAMPLWKQRMLEAVKAKAPAKHAALNLDTVTDDEVTQLYEAVCGPLVPAEGTRVVEAVDDNAPVTRADLQVFTLRGAARERIAAAKLPQASKDRLQAEVATAGADRLTEAAVGDLIKAEGDYVARITESGTVRVPMFGNGSIQVQDRSVSIKDMLDAFFDPTHKEHRSVQSLRECYIEITGDRRVTGQLRECDMGRMAESLGVMRESVASTTWGDALGDSITRRMQAVYTGLTDLDAWKRVATWGPVNDFRTQERIRIGGYGNLPAVLQGAAYGALTSPGDDKATYAITKRGGTEDVTLEAIKNDDVQALRRIPVELALAAKNTLYEFVFDFFRLNAAIWDTKALYHVDHGNLFTAAFSAAEYATHRLSMLKQTRAGSGKRLATPPKTLLVPFELEEAAFNAFQRATNLDKTFVQSNVPDIIGVNYWTDANDWCTVADTSILPVVEIGFLDGREEPELFVQDAPNAGSMFSNDKLTYKIRQIYGGGVLVDGEKGTTKAVVA